MTTALTIILIAVFAALSSFVQRVTGFGFGIVMMVMLPYIMPSYGEATALEALLGWLYLQGRRERINQLFCVMMEE